MAGTIKDILQNCTQVLSIVTKTDTDGVSESSFLRISTANDQIQVGMIISANISNPNNYPEGTTGIRVKSIETESGGTMKIFFGRPTDNSTAYYSVSGGESLTFTNSNNNFINTGVPGFKRGSFVKKFTSVQNYVFKTPPTISFANCSKASNYTVAVVDTKNSSNLLTAREFTVSVKIDKESSDDIIEFNAVADAGYNPSVNEITNYVAQTNDLPWHGGSRTIQVHGDPGAMFKIRIQQTTSGVTTDKAAETVNTIPESGVFERTFRFQKITANRYYTVTLSENSVYSNFTEMISPTVFIINQYIAPSVRSYASLGNLTNNSSNNTSWVNFTGNHLSANANQITGVSAYSSQTLSLKVTAKNVNKFINYNSTGAGFTGGTSLGLGQSGFTGGTSFSNSYAGNSATSFISFASATDNPASAWELRSGGNTASDVTNAGATNVGKSITKLVKVHGTKNTFMSRDFSTYGAQLVNSPDGTYNNNSNWPLSTGNATFTRSANSFSPVPGETGLIFGKLNNSLEEGKTYRLQYSIGGAQGGDGYVLKLKGHAVGNGDVVLPTSVGTHEIFFTQGSQVNGEALANTVVLNGINFVSRTILAITQTGGGNASMTINNFDLKQVSHDQGPCGVPLTMTTAYPVYAGSGKRPENVTVQLLAENRRISTNMEVRGVGLYSGTYVKGIDGKNIILSHPPSPEGIPKGSILTFYAPATIINTSDLRFVMTQGTVDDGSLPSNVVIEGQLAIKSVGSYDIDIDLDLGAFLEESDTALPSV